MATPYSPPPWSDAEKNFLLAELIKQANPPPQVLLNMLSNMNPQSFRWGDIPLPPGRSLNESMQVWEQLRRSTPGLQPLSIMPPGLGTQTPSPLSAPMPLKRPFPFDVTAGRAIRPKPSSTPSIFGQLTQIEQPPKKKRGRPTKQEAAARAEAQAMTGESSSGPRALRMQGAESTATVPGASETTDPSTANPSPADEPRLTLPPVSRMPISSILTPTVPKSASHSSSSSGKRKRGRSTRSEPDNFALASTSRSLQTQAQEYESPYARMASQSSTSPARAAAMRHRGDEPVPPSPQLSDPRPRGTSQGVPSSTTAPSSASPEYTRSM